MVDPYQVPIDCDPFFWFASLGVAVVLGACFGCVLCSLARAGKDDGEQT